MYFCCGFLGQQQLVDLAATRETENVALAEDAPTPEPPAVIVPNSAAAPQP